MSGIVGYAKSSTISQIDKCIKLMSRHDLANLTNAFIDDKVEFALGGLDTQNSAYNSIGGGEQYPPCPMWKMLQFR